MGSRENRAPAALALLALLALLVLGCGPWGPQGILTGGPFLPRHGERALPEKVYEQVAVTVTDDAHVAELMAPVLRRQFAIEIGSRVRRIQGATQAALSVYRLEDPSR